MIWWEDSSKSDLPMEWRGWAASSGNELRVSGGVETNTLLWSSTACVVCFVCLFSLSCGMTMTILLTCLRWLKRLEKETSCANHCETGGFDCRQTGVLLEWILTRGIRAAALLNTAAHREEGNCDPDLPIPSTSVGRREAWDDWVENGADRGLCDQECERNLSRHSHRRLGTWEDEPEFDSSEAEEGSKPTRDADDRDSMRGFELVAK